MKIFLLLSVFFLVIYYCISNPLSNINNIRNNPYQKKLTLTGKIYKRVLYNHCSFSIIIKTYSCKLHVHDYATQIASYSIRKRKPHQKIQL